MALKRNSCILAMFVIAVVSIVIFLMHHNSKKNRPTDSTPLVTLASLKTQIIPKTVSAFGTTVSPDSASVAAQTSGIITRIAFNPGDPVKKGQLLFVLQSNDISNQIKELKAAMLTSKDAYDRSNRLNKNYPGGIAQDTLEQLKLKYQQDLAAYDESLTAAHLTSPIDGIVSDTTFTVGSSVNMGTVLTQVINPASLQVKYSLPSQYASLAQKGQRVLFYPNDSNHSYPGTVAYVSPLLNATDFTLTLRANLAPNTTPLRPYLFGRIVQVIDPNHKALVIPQNLVQTDATGFYIYSINNRKVTKQYFNPAGVDKNGVIEVQNGLSDKAKIIISDYTSLSPGLIVKVKNQ